MTSSEVSGTITPRQGSVGIQEEQELYHPEVDSSSAATGPEVQTRGAFGVTPTRARRPESVGASTPASSPSELGSILSASDDDSRPVTKREVELLRVQIKGMFSNLRTALNEEVQRRDTVDTLVAGQLEALQSQMPTLNSNLSALNTQLQFQQGALANSRDEAERQRNDMLTTIESLSATVASTRNHLIPITPTGRRSTGAARPYNSYSWDFTPA